MLSQGLHFDQILLNRLHFLPRTLSPCCCLWSSVPVPEVPEDWVVLYQKIRIEKNVGFFSPKGFF